MYIMFASKRLFLMKPRIYSFKVAKTTISSYTWPNRYNMAFCTRSHPNLNYLKERVCHFLTPNVGLLLLRTNETGLRKKALTDPFEGSREDLEE